MRRLLWLPLAAACGVMGLTAIAPGQAPEEFGVLKTTPATPPSAAPKQVPAGIEPVQPTQTAQRPVNPYPVTPELGTWMICATTYVGPDGPNLSKQVADDLRNRHKLAAYIYNRGDEERRKQEEEFQAMQKRYPGAQLRRRFYRVQDQYAVLVAGFKDFDTASAFLPKLKALPVPDLKLDGDRSPFEVMTYQEIDPQTKKSVTKAGRMHPYHSAMVVRNPTIQGNGQSKPKWDPFWKKLNENEEYSLLKNPKAWTLVVKEYMGGRTLHSGSSSQGKSGFLSALGLGGSGGELLDASAAQAHELAKFLRHPNLGFTSWVLHTRYSSVVTVGGFDGPDDPELGRLQRQVANLKFNTKDGGRDPIGLMPTPTPVEVPRP